MSKMSQCHPERKHRSKGLCAKCYNQKMNERRYSDEEYKIKMQRRAREWYSKNKTRCYERDFNKHLKRNYGIDAEMYHVMHTDQNGLCKICHNAETVQILDKKPNRLAVDHCHTTGKVRGLLCFACNAALGRIEKVGLDNFKKYLKDEKI